MKPVIHIIAAVVAVALATPMSHALAQGKGSGDIPGGGGGGRLPSDQSEPAPAPSPPPHETQPTPPSERWNSVASAIWRVRGRVHVAIGYSGTSSSAEAARSNALDACVKAGGSGCKALGAWSAGCVYITTGHAVNRAGWASGATTEVAMKKCRGDGFTCKPPIGGCVD
jgi:hypothetical protein